MRHVSVQQLSAFVDGALVGVSRELVTRHLTACAQCRERHAGWRANDDALRRVLAWEPDDRTLEEWSSRVEMTLMAERKGMPPPEFSEQHHPVIGKAAPDSERLDIVVQSVRRTRRGAPPPQEPLPAVVFPPAAEPVSAASDPATPEPAPAAVVPPPEAAPVSAAEPAPAEPDATARPEVGGAVVESAPGKAAAPAPEPVAEAIASASEIDAAAGPAAEPRGKTPPWSEIALPAARAPEPEPAPAPVRAHLEFPPPRPRVLDAVPAADHFPDPPPPPLQQPPRLEIVPGIPALTGRPAPPNRRARPLLFLVSGLLLLVIAGSPLVPEVIRIPLPERWRWRLPRVEFVRRDHGVVPSVPAPATQLATSPTDVSVPVLPEPIAAPIDSHATRTGDGTSDPTPNAPGSEASHADTAASEAKPAAEDPRAKAESRTAKPTRSIVTERATPRPAPRKTAPPRAETEPEPPVTGVESPGTIIPATRVTTTVQAVPPPAQPTVPPAQPTPPPAPAPAPAQPAESEEDWPLLCGTVLDAAGAAVEGARVVLPANALTVRTDRRGRFCVACPPGMQGVRVEAAGHQLFSRTVELSTGMVEITISLTRNP